MVHTTVGSLYAGCGGIDKAFTQSGFNVIWANEFDKNACKTHRENHDALLFEQSVYDLQVDDLSYVDVLAAGSPCQPFSLGGHLKGFDDKRGLHFLGSWKLPVQLNLESFFSKM